jgi:hypothetical protein
MSAIGCDFNPSTQHMQSDQLSAGCCCGHYGAIDAVVMSNGSNTKKISARVECFY